jgi:hypothetical protein
MDFNRRDVNYFRTYGESQNSKSRRDFKEEKMLQRILDNYDYDRNLVKGLAKKKQVI